MASVLELGILSRGTASSPSYLLYLDVLLSLNKNIPHPGDVILHQMFVKGIGDLQPANEGDGGYVLVTIVYQGHLTLKIVNICNVPIPRVRRRYCDVYTQVRNTLTYIR